MNWYLDVHCEGEWQPQPQQSQKLMQMHVIAVVVLKDGRERKKERIRNIVKRQRFVT